MRPENEISSTGVLIHPEAVTSKKEMKDEIKTISLPLNATSTPAITINDKMENGNSNTPATTNGVHSPSLLPVSVQWLGQNPNLLGKFLEYYKVLNLRKLKIFIKCESFFGYWPSVNIVMKKNLRGVVEVHKDI